MTELLFIVTEERDGGYSASAVGPSIMAQADTDVELERNVREAVRVHFDSAESLPRVLHLHYVRDRTIPLVAQPGATPDSGRQALVGSVLSYDDPFAPACPAEEWEANR
jgi:predicted RNase H-like HicB family nuclease